MDITSCWWLTPRTGEIDVYGPHEEWAAVVEADRLRAELDGLGLGEVWVQLDRASPMSRRSVTHRLANPATGGPGPWRVGSQVDTRGGGHSCGWVAGHHHT